MPFTAADLCDCTWAHSAGLCHPAVLVAAWEGGMGQDGGTTWQMERDDSGYVLGHAACLCGLVVGHLGFLDLILSICCLEMCYVNYLV